MSEFLSFKILIHVDFNLLFYTIKCISRQIKVKYTKLRYAGEKTNKFCRIEIMTTKLKCCVKISSLIDWLYVGMGPHSPDAPRPYLTGPLCPMSKSWEPCSPTKAPDGPQAHTLNLLKPNDIYICHTAQLTSRHYILNIYSTNICTEYFKHAA